MKKILIVEDNYILAENMNRFLKSNFVVQLARSAEEAIEKVDQILPDFIILDILLDGHSAFSLLNELQTYGDTSAIPVVICSDLAGELDHLALEQYGVVKVFDKSTMYPRDILLFLKEVDREN